VKAVVFTKYGSPEILRLEDVERPIPKDDEVLIRIHAASLNAYDWHMLRADPFLVRLMGGGLLRPQKTRLGADMAGRVEAVGKSITQFRAGDEVFGDIGPSQSGSFGEYAVATERLIALKPANLSFEEAAAVPMAGITALQGLRDSGQIQPGQRVLINGASGGVGTFAVQIAKAFGAEVTAVCSTAKLEMARSLGAEHVIDYTKEDFTHNGQQYDLILAANGYHPIRDYKRALASKGIYATAGGSMRQLFEAMILGSRMSEKGGRQMKVVSAKISQKDFYILKELLEAGKIKPVIDRRYELSEVPEAMRYLEAGHAMGKVVITVEHKD
jgi:NADPH:quinone reductase-like Zn-dependent oxidoreductase